MGGHDNSSTASLSSVLGFSPDTEKWENEPKAGRPTGTNR
jgi:hypothetical protein